MNLSTLLLISFLSILGCNGSGGGSAILGSFLPDEGAPKVNSPSEPPSEYNHPDTSKSNRSQALLKLFADAPTDLEKQQSASFSKGNKDHAEVDNGNSDDGEKQGQSKKPPQRPIYKCRGRNQYHKCSAVGSYDSMGVNVSKILAHKEDVGWVTVSNESRSLDLITVAIEGLTFLGGEVLEPGLYGQIRLVLTDEATVSIRGESHALKVPSGSNGIKIVGGFELKPGFSTRITLRFDPTKSIVQTGQGEYILKPVVKIADVTHELLYEGPPDPKDVAPPLSENTVATFEDMVSFLYTGEDPIQTGVLPGTITSERVALIRGKVLRNDREPLSGVSVKIKRRIEFGETVSRWDGGYDLAVNGGGNLTLTFEKSGYLPVDAFVDTKWQSFMMIDDVILTELDPVATVVDFSGSGTSMQVARGSKIADVDGERTGTLMIPPGTKAQIILPNGGIQEVESLTIRATEYTVGPDGLNKMPAPLPSNTGYTYAVELSADEAIAVGASEVRFDRPTAFYVENFLGFATGTSIPFGYYDRKVGKWIAAKNGRVVEIKSISNGMADLDISGSGSIATASDLELLGITVEERTNLATMYSIGQALWRVQIEHFTPCDFNWGRTPPSTLVDASSTYGLFPSINVSNETQPRGDIACGSIVETQNQTIKETIPLTGVPFKLHYSSDRVVGNLSESTVDVPILGENFPMEIQRIDATIRIMGKTSRLSASIAPGSSARFTWDRLDTFRRAVQGKQNASIDLRYWLPATYQATSSEFESTFGFIPSLGFDTGIPTRTNIVLRRTEAVTLGLMDHKQVNIGGWSFTPHHYYDPSGKILYLGDGRRLDSGSFQPIITTVVGTGGYQCDDLEGPANTTDIVPNRLAVYPDGSLLVATTGCSCVKKISSDFQSVTTFAGSCKLMQGGYFWGDGGPAVNAILRRPQGIAIASDGTVYIADTENHRIRRVRPNGIIDTLAGNGEKGFGGDGGLAVNAQLNKPTSIVVSPDGNLYIVDSENHRVRQIGTNDIIQTIAGGGTDRSDSAIRAIDAWLPSPYGLALDQNGNLYVTTGNASSRVMKIDPAGNATSAAGRYQSTVDRRFIYEGVAALDANFLWLEGLMVLESGEILVADSLAGRVRSITADGFVNTAIGPAGLITARINSYAGDGGPATSAYLKYPRDVVLGKNGEIFIADSGNYRIRVVKSLLQGSSTVNHLIASEDGSEIYEFSPSGTHIRTKNAVTGVLVYEFGYDEADGLITVTDAYGKVTRITRNSNGDIIGMTSPNGEVIEFSVNTEGYLASVQNPAGEKYNMTYYSGGLIESFKKPKGNASSFQYDELGRLIKDTNAANGYFDLARIINQSEDIYTVNMSTAMNRQTQFEVARQSSGDVIQTTTRPSGEQTVRTKGTDEIEISRLPDGTTVKNVMGPDPRFGMQSPFLKQQFVTLPSGSKKTLYRTRQVLLSDPSDLLSVTSMHETTEINGKKYTTSYDASTRRSEFTTPFGRSSFTTMDENGKTLSFGVGGLTTSFLSYHPDGKLKSLSSGDRSVSFSYNDKGLLSETTNVSGDKFRYEYDLAGRVTKQILPDLREIGFEYDFNGNIVSIVPAGRPPHEFSFTVTDDLESYLPPLVGTLSDVSRNTYNLDGQLTNITRPDGSEIVLQYGSQSGKLDAISTPRGYLLLNYYLTTGQLKTINDADGGSLTYKYDGFLLKETSWTGSILGKVSQTFDSNWRVLYRGINNGSWINFQYNDDGLLTSAGELQITYSSQNDLITGTTLRSVGDQYQHNSYGEIESYDSIYSSTPLLSYALTRDRLGNIVTKSESFMDESHNYSYVYDKSGRLTQVTRDGTATTYAYDRNGNRLSMTRVSGTTEGTYDAQDRMITFGSLSFEYTRNGDLKTKNQSVLSESTSYLYDVFGNLREVGLPDGRKIEYIIDGESRRIGKKVNGILKGGFLYKDKLNPIAELTSTGAIQTRFVYGTKANVPEYMVKSGATYKIISDHLGSPRLIVNVSTGDVAQKLEYDEFGKVILDSNPGFQPFGFAGGIYDTDTNLVRFGARDYDAETGRFTSKDPILFRGGDTNLFGYVANDPINWVDPSGLARCSFGGGVLSCTSNNGMRTISLNAFTGAGPESSENGKIPAGTYDIRKLPNSDYGTWYLDPGLLSRGLYRAGLVRGGFNIHTPGNSSNGCVTAPRRENNAGDIYNLNQLLTDEMGSNILTVLPYGN